MAKTRIVNLAKELKIDVKDLIQRLKDELGLQEHFTYLSSLEEATVARVRQVISTAAPQVEELRVGENVKRRRRVAPVQVAAPEPLPEPLLPPASVQAAAAPVKEVAPEPTPVAAEATRVETAPVARPRGPEPAPVFEALRGPRVLGRIDLRPRMTSVASTSLGR